MVNVLELYKKAGALHEGRFLLASGMHSPMFLQSTTLTQYPSYTSLLAEALAEKIKEKGIVAEFTVGPAMGGIILAYEVARHLGIRSVFAEKKNNSMFIREAFSFSEGETFIAIEDVLTTGNSVLKAVKAAEERGAKCSAVACIINRSKEGTNEKFLKDYPLVFLERLHIKAYHPDELPEDFAKITLQEI